MPQKNKPRSGSMQYWPRNRASKQTPSINNWPDSDDAKPLAFAGYKVGMTHVMGIDKREGTPTNGEEIPFPVTVLETPPLQIATVRFYINDRGTRVLADEAFIGDHDDLDRKLDTPNEPQPIETDIDYDDITITMHTIPRHTGFNKKTPDIFEVHLGGTNDEKLTYIKEKANETIPITELFNAGDLVDTHGITKGKGTQGPVKRFGIGLKPHKSQKGRRRPGNLGPWVGQQLFMHRVPQAGQTGYQERTQYNNQIFKISDEPDEINVDGGYKHYGNVQSTYMLLKGSVQGPAKRLILFNQAIRPKTQPELPDITYISTQSKQGR